MEDIVIASTSAPLYHPPEAHRCRLPPRLPHRYTARGRSSGPADSTRAVEPGIDLSDLLPLDVVLVSHMHTDRISFSRNVDTKFQAVATLVLTVLHDYSKNYMKVTKA